MLILRLFQGSAKKAAKVVDPNAPKKPLSPYMMWLAASRGQLKTDNPGVSAPDLLKKAGEAWKSMGDEEKAVRCT